MNDFSIRKTLKNELTNRHIDDKDTLIVEELGLRHGVSRIDVAVINGILHGYEIKSNQDTLSRLPSQIDTYNLIFDNITLVAGYKHAYDAMNMIPEWWGVDIAEDTGTEEVEIYPFRECSKNPSPDVHAIVKLLWRDEAIKILDVISSANGVRSKTRRFIYDKLADSADPETICHMVREQLKSRRDWRADLQSMSCGD